MSIGQEVKEIQQFDWWRVRVQPLGFHTSAQSPKVKYLTIFLTLRVWTLSKSLGTLRMEIQTLVMRLNFFSIKYSKFDKRTFIIHFNGFLPSPLKRSLDDGFLDWIA